MRHHGPPPPTRPRLPRARAAARAVRRWLSRAAHVIGTYWYSVVGLSLIAGAAFQVDRALGLLVAGIAVLLLEWRVREPTDTPPNQPPRP